MITPEARKRILEQAVELLNDAIDRINNGLEDDVAEEWQNAAQHIDPEYPGEAAVLLFDAVSSDYKG